MKLVAIRYLAAFLFLFFCESSFSPTLLANAHLPLKEIKAKLDNVIEEWKGGLEQ